MEILLDTANLAEIETYIKYYPIAGVTTNPTILSREEGELLPLLRDIKAVIGKRQLHVQVTANQAEEMRKEADFIWNQIDPEVYIKVPVTQEGIRAVKMLKKMGGHVTGTAVYTVQQAMLAASAGADYAAPYYNRINNLNVDSKKVIQDMAGLLARHELSTRILAASFKNTQQIMDALTGGAQAVTVPAALLTEMVDNAVIRAAVEGFQKDWVKKFGERKIYEM